jgi:hypothetical protein
MLLLNPPMSTQCRHPTPRVSNNLEEKIRINIRRMVEEITWEIKKTPPGVKNEEEC